MPRWSTKHLISQCDAPSFDEDRIAVLAGLSGDTEALRRAHERLVWFPRLDVQVAINADGVYPAHHAICSGLNETMSCPRPAMMRDHDQCMLANEKHREIAA